MEIKKFTPQAQAQAQTEEVGNPAEPVSTPLSNPKRLPDNVINIITYLLVKQYFKNF